MKLLIEILKYVAQYSKNEKKIDATIHKSRILKGVSGLLQTQSKHLNNFIYPNEKWFTV